MRVFLLTLITFIASTVFAGRPLTNHRTAERVVAIGDIHGDFQTAFDVLKLAELIDKQGEWIGGRTVLVQVGDLMDRGKDERKLLDFFHELKIKAKKKGGSVHTLNGNHEALNVDPENMEWTFDRYVLYENGFTDFEEFYDSKKKDKNLRRLPRKMRGRAAAFRPGGVYAMRLSENNIAMKIGRTIFVHGGILPKYAKKGLGLMNRQVSRWMKNLSDIPEWLMLKDSPLWARDFSRKTRSKDCDVLESSLKILNADRMIVAHTPQLEGINSVCDGKAWRVDTGASPYYGGPLEALEILNGTELRIIRAKN